MPVPGKVEDHQTRDQTKYIPKTGKLLDGIAIPEILDDHTLEIEQENSDQDVYHSSYEIARSWEHGKVSVIGPAGAMGKFSRDSLSALQIFPEFSVFAVLQPAFPRLHWLSGYLSVRLDQNPASHTDQVSQCPLPMIF